MVRLRSACCLLTTLFLLSACALQPNRDAMLVREAHESISSFVLEGRVSVRNGDTAQHAGLVWQHEMASDHIELSGPLGQHAAFLDRDASGARLETSAHEVVSAADWGGLSERVLGAALPLDNMARWVIGVVEADAKKELDPQGRPQQADISGWRIKYLRYESEDPLALPTLIDMQREDINVRLKVDQWQIN